MEFGLGAETRKTNTQVPEPFGIEIGNPSKIPKGYEEKWFLNVHAIDTRGVEDRIGCIECRCNLYNNATTDGNGEPLRPGYGGGNEAGNEEGGRRSPESPSPLPSSPPPPLVDIPLHIKMDGTTSIYRI
ncbi:unnamed protein product [Lupinus luteus]|uniref:Uncharacterized protein n=1 Tax=Lupinus luteus TaxID=3873 RepID=A0AAV1WJW0_LUPLU